MRILQAELTRFGKFRNEIITPGKEIWQWTRPNESGKTTFADFIQFIFYGFAKSRAKVALEEDKLQKYMPWDGQTLLGALSIELSDGRQLRIERTSDERGKGKVTVLDDAGREMGIDLPGQTLLGVDAETFRNVFYLSHSDPIPHRTEQMEVAMKNLVTTGEESVSLETVLNKITTKQSQYMSQKNNRGKLKDKKEQARLLAGEIRQNQLRLQQYADLPDEKQLSEAILTEKTKAEAFAAYEKWQAEQQKKSRNERREQLRQTATAIEQKLAVGQTLSAEQTAQIGEALEEIEKKTILFKAAKESAETTEPPAELTETEQNSFLCRRKEVSKAGLWIVTAVLAVIGGIGCVFLLPLGLALLGVALILLLITLTRKSLPSAVSTLGFSSLAEFENAKTAAAERKLHLAAQQEQAASFQLAAQQAERALAECKEKYRPLLTQYGISDRAGLTAAISIAAEQSAVRERLAECYAELDRLGETETVADMAEPHCPDGTAEQTRQKLDELYNLKASLSVETERKNALLQQLSELADRKAELEAEIEKDEANYEILCIAADVMRQAGERLRQNYAPILRKSLADKIARFTGGRYDTVMVDADLNIRLYADGGMRPLGYFSDGTKDAVYIALRLAMADIIEKEEKLPLVFDDAFGSLDDSRLKEIQNYLLTLHDRQIILLQCK